MVAKWQQMSGAEKIEDLRRDLLKTIAFANQLSARAEALESRVSAFASQIHDLESKVAKLAPSKPKVRQRAVKGRATKSHA
jgi:hypothetical protein